MLVGRNKVTERVCGPCGLRDEEGLQLDDSRYMSMPTAHFNSISDTRAEMCSKPNHDDAKECQTCLECLTSISESTDLLMTGRPHTGRSATEKKFTT